MVTLYDADVRHVGFRQWYHILLAHLFGIPVFKYCCILASILANEVFLVTFPEQASTETRKYPG